MYRHILVAVDGSDTSKLALEHAVKLALDQHAKLRIAHVVDLASLNSISRTKCRKSIDPLTPAEICSVIER